MDTWETEKQVGWTPFSVTFYCRLLCLLVSFSSHFWISSHTFCFVFFRLCLWATKEPLYECVCEFPWVHEIHKHMGPIKKQILYKLVSSSNIIKQRIIYCLPIVSLCHVRLGFKSQQKSTVCSTLPIYADSCKTTKACVLLPTVLWKICPLSTWGKNPWTPAEEGQRAMPVCCVQLHPAKWRKEQTQRERDVRESNRKGEERRRSEVTEECNTENWVWSGAGGKSMRLGNIKVLYAHKGEREWDSYPPGKRQTDRQNENTCVWVERRESLKWEGFVSERKQVGAREIQAYRHWDKA